MQKAIWKGNITLLREQKLTMAIFTTYVSWNDPPLRRPETLKKCRPNLHHLSHEKKPDYFPLYWFVNRDPYNRFLNNPYITG